MSWPMFQRLAVWASKFVSRSLLITLLVLFASIYFTQNGIMDGTQWGTLAALCLTVWQAKDAYEKRAKGGTP